MKHSLIALALASLFAVPALADEPASPHTLTANVGVVSDYVFRGISQSQHRPALQGGVDYAHASGAYVGLWASQVSWTDRPDWTYQKDNRVEVDLSTVVTKGRSAMSVTTLASFATFIPVTSRRPWPVQAT